MAIKIPRQKIEYTEQEVCKSMNDLQFDNATDDVISYSVIVEKNTIETIGWTPEHSFHKGWFTGELIDIVYGRKVRLCCMKYNEDGELKDTLNQTLKTLTIKEWEAVRKTEWHFI